MRAKAYWHKQGFTNAQPALPPWPPVKHPPDYLEHGRVTRQPIPQPSNVTIKPRRG